MILDYLDSNLKPLLKYFFLHVLFLEFTNTASFLEHVVNVHCF